MTAQEQSYRKIRLNHGQYALVDVEDYERIAKNKWFARLNPHTRTYYAYRTAWPVTRGNLIAMHREIMGLIPCDGKQVDHRKPERTLDNRKKNLRVCTPGNNSWNMRKMITNSSGFKGVYWHKLGRKWMAYITVRGKRMHLGLHDSRKKAHLAYRKAALEHFGEFARP